MSNQHEDIMANTINLLETSASGFNTTTFNPTPAPYMEVEKDLETLVRVANSLTMSDIQKVVVFKEIESMKAEIESIKHLDDHVSIDHCTQLLYERLHRAEASLGRFKVAGHHGVSTAYADIEKENDILIDTIGDIDSSVDTTRPNIAIDIDLKDEVLNIRYSTNAGVQYMNLVNDLVEETVDDLVAEQFAEPIESIGYEHLDYVHNGKFDRNDKFDALVRESAAVDKPSAEELVPEPVEEPVVEPDPPTKYDTTSDIIDAFESQDSGDIDCIGTGGDGKVYKFDGYAIKVYNDANIQGLEVYDLIGSTNNANVIDSKHYTKNDVTYEVMTYYPLGSLGDNVDIFKGNFDLQKELFDQLLDGIKFLHSNNIQHRDLKTGNVLVESLEPLQIKVCDFGRSRANANSMSITQSVGTFKFMAPESLAGMPTEKSDLFSLGMIMAVIGTKGHGDPFVNSGHLTDNELDWDKINVDDAMARIIKGLTIKDQYKRGVSAFKEGWVTRLNAWLGGLLSSTPSGGTYMPSLPAPPRRDKIVAPEIHADMHKRKADIGYDTNITETQTVVLTARSVGINTQPVEITQ